MSIPLLIFLWTPTHRQIQCLLLLSLLNSITKVFSDEDKLDLFPLNDHLITSNTKTHHRTNLFLHLLCGFLKPSFWCHEVHDLHNISGTLERENRFVNTCSLKSVRLWGIPIWTWQFTKKIKQHSSHILFGPLQRVHF